MLAMFSTLPASEPCYGQADLRPLEVLTTSLSIFER